MRFAILLALSTLSTTAHAKPETSPIERAGQLPVRRTPDDIAALVTAAEWIQFHPNKKVSTWESRRFTFGADTVTITTVSKPGPRDEVVPWKVIRGGRTPVIQIANKRFTLAVCPARAETLCLDGPWL